MDSLKVSGPGLSSWPRSVFFTSARILVAATPARSILTTYPFGSFARPGRRMLAPVFFPKSASLPQSPQKNRSRIAPDAAGWPEVGCGSSDFSLKIHRVIRAPHRELETISDKVSLHHYLSSLLYIEAREPHLLGSNMVERGC